MPDNFSVLPRDGYQAYFSFETGFLPQSRVVSRTTVDRSFAGTADRIVFDDGSKIIIAFPPPGQPGDPPQPAHVYVLSPGQDLPAVGDPFQYVVDLGASVDWRGNPFSPSFLATGLAGSNIIQPDGTVTGVQTIRGYGGEDDLFGGSGNDRLIDDGGRVRLAGGSGDDTFVLGPNVVIAPNAQRGVVLSGTDPSFNGPVAPGEVNTIEAHGDNDFSLASILRINKLAFVGTGTLTFGFGNFDGTNHIAPDTTIVGDSGVNALRIYGDTTAISTGHSNLNGGPQIDLSHLTFQNWTRGQDTVTIVGLENSPNTIVGTSVGTTILGGRLYDALTGGAGDDVFAGGRSNDTIDGGAGIDTAVFSGNAREYDITTARDGNGVLHTTVQHARGTRLDGTDTLTHVERLQFADQTVSSSEQLFDFYSAAIQLGTDYFAGAGLAVLQADAGAVLTASRTGNEATFALGAATPGRQHAYDSMARAADQLAADLSSGRSGNVLLGDAQFLFRYAAADDVGLSAASIMVPSSLSAHAPSADAYEASYVTLLDQLLEVDRAVIDGAGQARVDALIEEQLAARIGTQGAATRDRYDAYEAEILKDFASALSVPDPSGAILDTIGGLLQAEIVTIVEESTPANTQAILAAADVLSRSGTAAAIGAISFILTAPDDETDYYAENRAAQQLVADENPFRTTGGDQLITHLGGRSGQIDNPGRYYQHVTRSHDVQYYINSYEIIKFTNGLETLFGNPSAYDPYGNYRPAKGFGDVHLTTFSGSHYDFQGAGEFIYAKSNIAGDSFQVQARLVPSFPGTSVTVATEIAAAIGTDRVTFDTMRSDYVWLNGAAVALDDANPILNLSGGQLVRVSPVDYVLAYTTGVSLDVRNSGGYLDVDLDGVFGTGGGYAAGAVGGLLGTGQGQANDFSLPDGTVLHQPLTIAQLYSTFGNAWRVSQAGSLLDYGPGQSTATFTDTNVPRGVIDLTTLPPAILQAAEAVVAGKGVSDPIAFQDAVLDFLATGDPAFIDSARRHQDLSATQAVVTSSGSASVFAGIAAGQVSVIEPLSGPTTLSFTVYLTAAQSTDTPIAYTVVAPDPIDFGAGTFGGTLPAGQAVIAAGDTTATFTIQVPAGATGTDPDKILKLQITAPGGQQIFAATAQTDILNPHPVITSDGGGDTAALSVVEGHTGVTIVFARDLVPGAHLSYAVTGGADGAKFQIDATAGLLKFAAAPDLAAPTDADHNNTYLVQVTASDGTYSDSQLITVGVRGPSAPPNPPPVPVADPTSPPAQPGAIGSVPTTDPVGVPALSNHLPVLLADMISALAHTVATGSVLTNDTDQDGDVLVVTSVRYAGGAMVVVPASGTVTVESGHGARTIGRDGHYGFVAAVPVQDAFTYTVSDGHGGTASATLTATTAAHAPGLDATFDFAFASTTVSYVRGEALLTGPDGVTRDVTGIGHLHFTDGTIDEADGAPLVDDLSYYANYRDVFAAHVDPDQHYAQFGWREGRDPNPLFSTKMYLAANPDVASAGINPLTHYDTFGWREGRDPGPGFSTRAYRAANPDVAQAGIDPLLHDLAQGQLEGRLTFPGFAAQGVTGDLDASYYLANNRDVAAAGADPLQHFLTYGWKEGRDPDAFFSTSGYLAANPDVAASGTDPLLHYEAYGWREGRNPSTQFSTNGYLAANPDVAAAHIDPLQHYLQFGQAEGRHGWEV